MWRRAQRFRWPGVCSPHPSRGEGARRMEPAISLTAVCRPVELLECPPEAELSEHSKAAEFLPEVLRAGPKAR